METERPNSQPNIFDGVNAYQKEEANKVIKNARTSLFVISTFTLGFSFIMYFMNSDKEGAVYELVADGVISLIFAGLGYLSNKKPYFALLTGLILYFLLIIANAIVDHTTLYKGIILKVLIVTWLIKGIASARSIRKLIEV